MNECCKKASQETAIEVHDLVWKNVDKKGEFNGHSFMIDFGEFFKTKASRRK